MPARKLPIDVDLLRHQHALGVYTNKELAEIHGCSESTIERKINPAREETNRRCMRRWYYHGPLPEQVEKVCLWCLEFYQGNQFSKTCSDSCKCEYVEYREFYIPISKRMLEEHFQKVEFNKENCRKLGLTVDEARGLLELNESQTQ